MERTGSRPSKSGACRRIDGLAPPLGFCREPHRNPCREAFDDTGGAKASASSKRGLAAQLEQVSPLVEHGRNFCISRSTSMKYPAARRSQH
jgi:hypothetical protein